MRVADPHAELPIKNFKYVKNCTEMYLAKRGIERIGNFESFVNLEVLWINDNAVRRALAFTLFVESPGRAFSRS